jgi:NADPH:quinone reductase-like Zn-dependent oxidoreductase
VRGTHGEGAANTYKSLNRVREDGVLEVMKAMLLPRYGPPEVFSLGEAPMPAIGVSDLLVRVGGSSVNPIDCHMRNGDMRAWIRKELPAIIGVEVAGEVVEVGASVTRFRKGDRVYAYVGPQRAGGYAEYVALPESFAAKIPKNVKTEDAGVIPGVGLTAYEAFVLHAPVSKGMHVLINGAAGGVGAFAVQIAKARGAHVTGVCRGAKAPYVRRIGADAVVDYETEDILETTKRFDVILQAARTQQLAGLRRLLKPEGRLVTITGGPLTYGVAKLRNMWSRQKTISFFVRTSGLNLEALSKMVESNQVKPQVDRVFSWRELAEAHRRVETGRVTGKIAIRVGD